jgi:predicted nucleic acid-binding protein
MEYMRKVFLDASALITWLLYPDKPEPGGERLSKYLNRPGRQRYSNEPCLTEVLARLKWMRHYNEITDDGYFMRINLLKMRIEHKTLHISKFNYWEKKYTDRALQLTKNHQNKIDFIDALQIVDILEGPFKTFSGPSRTLLITMDNELRNAAKAEGVDVWSPADEIEPD